MKYSSPAAAYIINYEARKALIGEPNGLMFACLLDGFITPEEYGEFVESKSWDDWDQKLKPILATLVLCHIWDNN